MAFMLPENHDVEIKIARSVLIVRPDARLALVVDWLTSDA